MYNDSYYSRRGRTIERKKIDNGQVINPRLVPIYYNYLKDNGMFPSAPVPPAHVDDGTCIAVDYDNVEYTFPGPSNISSLTNALGTLLDTFGIDVDITKVDHINLSFYLTSSGANRPVFYISATNPISLDTTLTFGTYNGSTTSNPFTMTFVRDYSHSGTVFYCPGTLGSSSGNRNLVTYSAKPSYIYQNDDTHVYITRIVVATLTE